jgi:hypothetical protein
LPEITPITSEALQATVRRLLPSQRGFGDDLQATNLIQPIIDLTPTAEGSALPTDLARALSHGSNTFFDVSNTNTTLINTPGFWRIMFDIVVKTDSTNNEAKIQLSDGSTTFNIVDFTMIASGTALRMNQHYDFIAYLDAGDSLIANSNATGAVITGSYRQVADKQGNIVNPVGFAFE